MRLSLSVRLLLFTIAVITASAGGLSAQVASADALVIGLLLPPEEAEASSLRQGVVLGVDHANQSAAVQAEVVIRGRVGQWGADAGEAARMVTDDGARGLIAPPDGAASHLALQVSGRTAVPVVSLCADSSVSQTGVPWMVRVVPRTVDEASALFTGLSAKFPARTAHWAALVPDGRAGRESARDLKQAATACGCSLENPLAVKSPLTNAASVRDQILNHHPDAILLWLDGTPAGVLVKSLRAAGFAGPLAGPGRLRSANFAAAAGEAMEGFVLPSPVFKKGDEAVFRHFQTAFRDRFGREPDPMAAMSYDAARLLIHILGRGGDRPPRRAFPPGFSFPGASSRLSFDSEGNREADLQLLEARHGRFVPIPSQQVTAKRKVPQ
jgi:branched-chain amino acid transport system substrate-binding protein